jgi:predicted RNA-binding Zn-ribbon protein involved in translation (DUF1610 family)
LCATTAGINHGSIKENMGTLEHRFSQRVAEFQRRRDEGGAQGGLDGEEIEYLLDAVPFIREYAQDAVAVQEEAAAAAQQAPGPLAKFVGVTHRSNKNNVLQRYLMTVEKQIDNTTVAATAAQHDEGAPVNPSEAEFVCAACNVGMHHDTRESVMVCPSCGLCRAYSQMSTNNLTYEQEVHQDVVTYYSYKRLNHFCEWLNSLQAKVRRASNAAIFFCCTEQYTTMASVRTVRSLLAVALFGAIVLSVLVVITELVGTGKGKRRGWYKKRQWDNKDMADVRLPKQPVVEPDSDSDDDDDDDDDDDVTARPSTTPAPMPPIMSSAPPTEILPEPVSSMDGIDQYDVPEFATALR